MPLRPTPRRVALACTGTLALAACALDLTGRLAGPGPTTDGADGTAVDPRADAPLVGDGGLAPDGPTDADLDAPPDVCPPTITVVESFAAGVPAAWLATGQTSAAAADGGAGPYVVLIPPGLTSRTAGLWLRAPRDFTTFTIEAKIRALRPGGGNLSDGVTLTWLEIADDAGALGNVLGGVALGLPRNARGYAVALDIYDNGGSANDPNVPYWGLFRVDPSRGDPGTYDWHVRSTAAISNAFGAWHTVVVGVAGGTLDVTIDGQATFTGVTGIAPLRGTLGFTAAVGGVTGAGFDVDEVRLTLPNPACGD